MVLLRRFVAIAALTLMAQHLSLSQSTYDVVYLKSGGKIIGRIVQKSESKPIQVVLDSKEVFVIAWEDIRDIGSVTLPSSTVSSARGRGASSSLPFAPPIRSIARGPVWTIRSRAGIVFTNATLDSLRGDMLFISTYKLVPLESDPFRLELLRQPIDSVAVGSVKELRLTRKSSFFTYAWIGAGIGALGGAVIGMLMYHEPEEAKNNDASRGYPRWEGFGSFNMFGPETYAMVGGVLGAVSGFLLGGILSLHQSADIVYEMPENAVAVSKMLIQDILEELK